MTEHAYTPRQLQLIEAAGRLFRANGFRAVTMEMIAAKAGVAKATLYSHFPDKTAVFTAVADYVTQQIADALQIELERCDQLGIPLLVSHPGAHMGTGVETGVSRVAEGINIIHTRMTNGTCSLAIETTAGQGTTLGRTFEEIAQIIDGVDDKSRICVCFDTCHVFAAGYDIRTQETYAVTMQQFDEIVGLDRLQVLHLNDSAKEFGSFRDRHAHIGQGAIGADAFQFLLRDERLGGRPGILETPKDDDVTEDLMNLTTLRGLM